MSPRDDGLRFPLDAQRIRTTFCDSRLQAVAPKEHVLRTAMQDCLKQAFAVLRTMHLSSRNRYGCWWRHCATQWARNGPW